MFAFAFKNGRRAAQLETGISHAFSLAICDDTCGDFSHVECWHEGPITAAVCSASREPDGISFRTIDLSDRSLWSIIEIPSSATLDLLAYYFAKGSAGKKYDGIGILRIGTGIGTHDPSQRFCSEYASELGATVFQPDCLKGADFSLFAPSGPSHRFLNGLVRRGLRDTLLAAGFKECS